MQRVLNFSGGLTSAYMVIHHYRPGDIVLFCDTTREHESTYQFIRDFEAHEGIPVTWLQFPGGWEGFLKNWNGGKNIPNRVMRQCTIQLKIKTARRYLRSLGICRYENFIGFRYDEPLRVKRHSEHWKKVTTHFPLYEDKICKPQIVDYFLSKPYKLNVPKILGNCDLCFMKGKAAIIAILSQHPELADKWIADEESATNIYKHTYLKEMTMRQAKEIAQSGITKIYPLEAVEPMYNCACAA